MNFAWIRERAARMKDTYDQARKSLKGTVHMVKERQLEGHARSPRSLEVSESIKTRSKFREFKSPSSKEGLGGVR